MKLKTLKPTLRTVGPAVRTMGQTWRTSGMTTTERGYGYRWQKARARFLRNNPLCVYCERAGRVELATVVDHIVPHRGNPEIFWDESRWQSLCKPCHDVTKAREERGSPTHQGIGTDGWPVDPGASTDYPPQGGPSRLRQGRGS
ncbi:HNH endonuclease [Pseudorhodoferax soli]|uniref:Putative HNH nuclease YajD n=1 Tax=Pseudorhodoferax soli TaxID=545864 RepID=A0A368XDS3_9BURK|nr:HNH endonuclease [Pseudorhodoferax soli]RCW65178.1 HNH endonuclease [Pseudorhodoferax soli]